MKLLEHAQYLVYEHFLRLWSFSLFLILMVGWLLSRHRVLSEFDSVASSSNGCRKSSIPYGYRDYLLLAGFFLFVGLYVFVILFKEDFACNDCDQLIDHAVMGRRYLPPIWPAGGRFFPLMFQEFNVLRFFTRTPLGFHSFAVVQLLILVLVLFVLLRDWSVPLRVSVLAAALVTPSFVIPFIGLVYPERNVLLWLGVLMLCLERSSSDRNPIYLTGCLIATHFLLYYKEPIVVIVVVYALQRLSLGARLDDGRRMHSWSEYSFANAIPIGMILLAGVYTLFFSLALSAGPHNFNYVRGLVTYDRITVLRFYFQTDWLLPVLFVVVFYRFLGFALSEKQLDPFWDSLAMGALFYVLVLLGIGIYRDYYLAPVDLIALLYLVREFVVRQRQGPSLRSAVVATVFVLLFIHNSAYSALRVIERKQIIALERQLVDFLRAYKSSGDTNQVKLYFPFCYGYSLLELSSYLNYRGIPILGQHGSASLTGPLFVITSPERFSDSRCVANKAYACFHADNPEPGDLIIILPEDSVQQREVEQSSANTTALVEVSSPQEEAPMGRVFRILHRLSLELGLRDRPQPWWQLYIFHLNYAAPRQNVRTPAK